MSYIQVVEVDCRTKRWKESDEESQGGEANQRGKGERPGDEGDKKGERNVCKMKG